MRVALSTNRKPKARPNGAAADYLEMQRREKWRADTMAKDAKDERDILELLQEELAFIERGGYGRSVRTAA